MFLIECRPTMMMEAVRTSETSVDVQLRTRQYIPEESELHTLRRENLKSDKVQLRHISEGFLGNLIRFCHAALRHRECELNFSASTSRRTSLLRSGRASVFQDFTR
jgi:hypothetical protein